MNGAPSLATLKRATFISTLSLGSGIQDPDIYHQIFQFHQRAAYGDTEGITAFANRSAIGNKGRTGDGYNERETHLREVQRILADDLPYIPYGGGKT